MDDDLLLKSLLCVAESLEDLLGQHGARVMLRAAGRKAAASLIEGLPLQLTADEAVSRSADLLEQLGFAERCSVDDGGNLEVSGLPINKAREEMGLTTDGTGRYFCVGLFEGFAREMSGMPIQVDNCDPEGKEELWTVTV
jgi:hypothetical protein